MKLHLAPSPVQENSLGWRARARIGFCLFLTIRNMYFVHGRWSTATRPQTRPHVPFLLPFDETHPAPPLSAQENSLGRRAPKSFRWIYGRPTTLPVRAPRRPLGLQTPSGTPVTSVPSRVVLYRRNPAKIFRINIPCAICSPRVTKDRTARLLHYFDNTI
jgi:hypothetical protein